MSSKRGSEKGAGASRRSSGALRVSPGENSGDPGFSMAERLTTGLTAVVGALFGSSGAETKAEEDQRIKRDAATNRDLQRALEDVHLSMGSFWEVLGRITDKKPHKRNRVEKEMVEKYGSFYDLYMTLRERVHATEGEERDGWMKEWVNLNHRIITHFRDEKSRAGVAKFKPFEMITHELNTAMERAIQNQRLLTPWTRDAEAELMKRSPFRVHPPPPPDIREARK